MASPFQSYEEFYEASGPIYTFADRPVIIALLLIASVLLFLYFIYAAYTMGSKGSTGEPKNPLALSILLVASTFSAAEAVYQQVSNQGQRPQASVTRSVDAQANHQRRQPLAAMLGLTGVAGVGAKRSRRQRRQRLFRRD
jgi:hypothetical protein